MEADSGIKLKELRVDGGASSNKLLMQFQADLLGRPRGAAESLGDYRARRRVAGRTGGADIGRIKPRLPRNGERSIHLNRG